MSLYKRTIKCLHRFLKKVLDFQRIDLGVQIMQKHLASTDPAITEDTPSDETVEEMLDKAKGLYPDFSARLEPCKGELASRRHRLGEDRLYIPEGGRALQPAE